ncbi:MAG TPA: hypothetical protein VJ866_23395 [Pyrinomonadaceae bacterium]|nr:hypothetical protein [Pyrinomonadaceae bacterium]
MSRVSEARRSYYAARDASEQARASYAEALAALTAALRAHGEAAPEVASARGGERSARKTLAATGAEAAAALAALNEERRAALGADAAADVSSLDAAYPVALFPVRVETQFDATAAPATLRVRVYPDEALADSHELALMPRELEAGRQFWRAIWRDGNEEEAWSALVASFGARRAAWIAIATAPSNVDTVGVGEPEFDAPAAGLRTHAWTRAVEARLLPDRWVVVAYRDGRLVRSAQGQPVSEPLALTASPDPRAPTLSLGGSGPAITEDAAWTLQYDRALLAGMAIDLPLDATDLTRGFDRVLVFGVKSTMNPDETADRLRALIEAQRFTCGVAFVPQGTRTNNTTEGPSSYPPPDPGGTNSFAYERRVVSAGDGDSWAAALGLDGATVRHIAGADLSEQSRARAMLRVLWPATLGYFLEQMMDPVFGSGDLRAARDWALAHVRGRGPFPVLRISNAPYGLLPASSLSRWRASAGSSGPAAQLPGALRGLLPFWQAATPRVPRVGRTDDADADLLESLGVEASTREVRLRCVAGPDLLWNGLAFGGVRARRWLESLRARASTVLAALARPDWEPRVAYMSFADWPDRIALPLVAPTPLSEASDSAPPYINAIRRASIELLRDGTLPGVGRPATLLDHLLRYAALREYAQAAFDLNVRAQRLSPSQRREPELVGITPGARQRGTTWSLFDLEAPQAVGKLRDVLGFAEGKAITEELTDYGRSLELLAGASSAELERLFTETLDVCSHRIDAWVTGLASQRLAEMREANRRGVHLGGYAWVENLRPARGAAPSGGFIHAPSLDRATAAAVLRNAFLSRGGERDADGGPRKRYAIDLSSRRVRAGVELLDELRQGQQLGAVLGYRVERALHDQSPPLDRYFSPLRNLYPLVAFKGPADGSPGVSAESVAARNVVDGLGLWRDWARVREDEAGRRAFFARTGLPARGSEEADALATAFDAVGELLDAVGDLLTAEGVHQSLRGNMSAASASLDSISRGARPPDPELIKTRRFGTVLTHRVALILGGDAEPFAGAWAELPPTPRASGEPFLDAFASRLLGNPADILCRATYRTAGDEASSTMRLSVADVALAGSVADKEGGGLRAVDLLTLARSTAAGGFPRELELRIADAVRASSPGATDINIADERGVESGRTLSEALEVARALNAALGTARSLRREDLRLSEETALSEVEGGSPTTIFASDVTSRVDAALAALAALAADLAEQLRLTADATVDATPVVTLLKRAAQFGVPQAYPEESLASAGGRAELLARGRAVQAELARRQAGAAAATDPTGVARAVFGDDFMLLSSFLPENAAELERGRDVSTEEAGDPLPVRTWFQRAARVRPALARWRMLSLSSAAFGVHTDDFAVTQLPARSSARWAALGFRSEDDRPKALTLSLALHEPFGPPPPGGRWTGLLLDAWPELIPDPVDITGVAFHYDDPGAEAPQAILLAVPPDPATGWSLEALASVVNETLDLAKVRVVDGELLNSVCQFLPAIYLADNARGETIVADLSGALVREGP